MPPFSCECPCPHFAWAPAEGGLAGPRADLRLTFWGPASLSPRPQQPPRVPRGCGGSCPRQRWSCLLVTATPAGGGDLPAVGPRSPWSLPGPAADFSLPGASPRSLCARPRRAARAPRVLGVFSLRPRPRKRARLSSAQVQFPVFPLSVPGTAWASGPQGPPRLAARPSLLLKQRLGPLPSAGKWSEGRVTACGRAPGSHRLLSTPARPTGAAGGTRTCSFPEAPSAVRSLEFLLTALDADPGTLLALERAEVIAR